MGGLSCFNIAFFPTEVDAKLRILKRTAVPKSPNPNSTKIRTSKQRKRRRVSIVFVKKYFSLGMQHKFITFFTGIERCQKDRSKESRRTK